jgi:tetratricopeptide (TPR) repeat protein
LRLDGADHRAAILLATSLRNRTYFGDLEDIPGRDREIEQLVLGHLQGIQDDPIYLSAAAEMLYELGYHDTAQDIAERAVDLGAGIAACYMVLGRIQVLQGNFTEGLAYYEHSLEISTPDSLFYRMLKTRQCIACKAAGDQDRVRELTRYITSHPLETGGTHVHRILREQALRIYFLGDDPEAFGRKNRLMASLVPRGSARRALLLNYYLTARFFRHEEHRRRVLAGALQVFVGRYGADIVPQVIRDSVPSLLAGSGAASAA